MKRSAHCSSPRCRRLDHAGRDGPRYGSGAPDRAGRAFDGAMPTGVTVAPNGRIFVNFPQWGDQAPFTVAELVDGKAVPYPDAATNRPDPADPAVTSSRCRASSPMARTACGCSTRRHRNSRRPRPGARSW